jgi:hypothetical protein
MKTQEPVLQSIAGVTPPSTAEVTVMTAWPSVGGTSIGKFLGRLYRIHLGFGPVRIGRLALLMTMPAGLMLYLSMRLPWAICRFQVTNRRVTVNRGVRAAVERFVELSRFDTIELVVQPGQEWFDCGDLVFRNGPVETLRLNGVSRPEPFRRVCLEVRQSYVGVQEAIGQSTGAA